MENYIEIYIDNGYGFFFCKVKYKNEIKSRN